MELNWIKTRYGFYATDDDCLIFACDKNDIIEDNICEVQDMTSFTEEEYNELSEILLKKLNYKLNGQFL